MIPEAAHEAAEWMDQALCAQVGGDDVWFPPKGASVEPARRICSQCPVAAICLKEFIYETEGIYSGTTPKQRKKLRANLPKPPRKIQTACQKAGHDWGNPDNVRVRKSGTRYCGECDRIAHQAKRDAA